MDKLSYYCYTIKKILTEYEQLAAKTPNPSGIDSVLAFDDERNQYLWFQTGWHEGNKVREITVYVRIKNDKFYIEEDLTEDGIANELLKQGIPKENIVLAFQPPELRQYTEFATA